MPNHPALLVALPTLANRTAGQDAAGNRGAGGAWC